MDEHSVNRAEQFTEQFTEQFQVYDDMVQVVLPGHLLIEQALDAILEKFVFHPEYLRKIRFEFEQKFTLARSLSLDRHDKEMWKLIKAINNLRNDIAHALKSEKREQKAQHVIELYWKVLRNEQMVAQQKDFPKKVLLLFALAACLGFLTREEVEKDRFRGYVLDGVINFPNPASNPISKSSDIA